MPGVLLSKAQGALQSPPNTLIDGGNEQGNITSFFEVCPDLLEAVQMLHWHIVRGAMAAKGVQLSMTHHTDLYHRWVPACTHERCFSCPLKCGELVRRLFLTAK